MEGHYFPFAASIAAIIASTSAWDSALPFPAFLLWINSPFKVTSKLPVVPGSFTATKFNSPGNWSSSLLNKASQ